jgi:hypothetical protein
MKKADITKMIIKIGYSYRDGKGKLVNANFPVSLQGWIKMSPEEQEKYVAQHTKTKIINYDVL